MEGTKRIILDDEAWWFKDAVKPVRRNGVIESWSIGIDAAGGGTHGEWTLNWHPYGGGGWQLDIFDDGYQAARESGFLRLLDDYIDADQETLKEALFAEGWIDKTPRKDPFAQRIR